MQRSWFESVSHGHHTSLARLSVRRELFCSPLLSPLRARAGTCDGSHHWSFSAPSRNGTFQQSAPGILHRSCHSSPSRFSSHLINTSLRRVPSPTPFFS